MKGRILNIVPTALSVLFFFGGCSLTPPAGSGSAPTVSTIHTPNDPWSEQIETEISTGFPDPFLAALKTAKAEEKNVTKKHDEFFFDDEPFEPDTKTAANVSKTSIPEKTEAVEKAEVLKPIGLAELEAILSKDLWARNVELPRWIDNDMKDPNPKRDTHQLQRLADMYRMNMSDKEKRKKGENVYEYSAGLVSTWRWYHKEIEDFLAATAETATDDEERISPAVFLLEQKYRDPKHAVLRANAAITLGRDGDGRVERILLKIVQNEKLRLELRCAAVETLGKLKSVASDELIPLIELAREKEIDTTNRQTGLPERKFRAGSPTLWTEILTALSEKIGPWESPCFTDPFSARSVDMRKSVAKIWARCEPPRQSEGMQSELSPKRAPNQPAKLPPEFLDFARQETNPAIRVDIIRTLGRWKEPELFQLVRSDLNQSAAVRDAAMDALADAGCAEAIPLIREKLRDTVPANRAKAVDTLRKLQCYDDVLRMGDDKAWQVRMEVAKALSVRATGTNIALAKRYLTDTAKVQEETLKALAAWPIEESGPVLLEATKSTLQNTRLQATAMLEQHLDDIGDFNPTELPKNQVAQHAELASRFKDFMKQKRSSGNISQAAFYTDSTDDVDNVNEENGKTNSRNDPLLNDVRKSIELWNRPGLERDQRRSIEERLKSQGDRLPILFEYLLEAENLRIPESLDPVLASADPIFAMILRLDPRNDPIDVRKAASEIVRTAKGKPLGILASQRILQRARRLDDPLVLSLLLDALDAAKNGSARVLARSLLDAESPLLRRRACETLREKGDARDLSVLADMLYDSSPTVVRATFEAVAAILVETEDDEYLDEKDLITENLLSLLLQANAATQVDIAATLHVLGHPSGRETLKRLSLSPDAKIKQYVAQTVGELEDPDFVPILIRFLDENGTVRHAALEALPRVTGRDVGRITDEDEYLSETLSSTQKRIARWKNWAAAD